MQTPLSADDAEIARRAVEEHGSYTAAAQALGLTKDGIYRRMKLAKVAEPKPFEIEELPDELPSAEELIERRRKQFDRKRIAKEARVLVPVRVTCDGPIGIALMGDPHVDDDGTDIAKIERHVKIINNTEGLFGGNVGDYTNNWVGRLARLYGQQSLSAAEGWVLAEWLIRSVRWLFLIGGNHDLWSGAGDPIQWMAKSARVTYEAHGMRLGLTFPNKRVVRLNARHDFPGHSQYSTVHGPSKAAKFGWRDHLLVCGHKHTSGYGIVQDPMTGLVSHVLRVASYKTFDRYAEEKGMDKQDFTVCPVAIIRPRYADDDPRLVKIELVPEDGADYLRFLRKRKSE